MGRYQVDGRKRFSLFAFPLLYPPSPFYFRLSKKWVGVKGFELYPFTEIHNILQELKVAIHTQQTLFNKPYWKIRISDQE